MVLIILGKIIWVNFPRYICPLISSLTIVLKDIVPTSIEREISDWRHAVNHAAYIDDIPIKRTEVIHANRNIRDSVETSSTDPIIEELNDTVRTDSSSEAGR